MSRSSWDKYFIELCDLVATRATCDRKNVGSVIVKDNRILSTGYNGSLPGLDHCDDPLDAWICTKCNKQLDFNEHMKGYCTSGHAPGCAGMAIRRVQGGHDMQDNHCVRAVHSEVNAIAQAARLGIPVEKATLYCNTRPCWACFKVIVSAGIIQVVYRDEYDTESEDRITAAAHRLYNFTLRKYSGGE